MDEVRPLIIGAGADYAPAKGVFSSGGVIAYPTETFYGLCVDPFNADAVERLYRLKGRPSASPIPLIIGEMPMLGLIAAEVPPQAVKLIERFWPGPLTIVLKAASSLPSAITAGTGTIAVRLSGSTWARKLSCELASPITSTSANPSGQKPPVTAEETARYFKDSIGLLIDGGVLKGTKGSTIVDASGSELKVIREGEIPSSGIFTS
ncbi:Threonylcarbamoyl-AMP synthase [uncultured bacterium]|nr:Threonylcarbamoyl-AMP synthase [uncultured bacterium]